MYKNSYYTLDIDVPYPLPENRSTWTETDAVKACFNILLKKNKNLQEEIGMLRRELELRPNYYDESSCLDLST